MSSHYAKVLFPVLALLACAFIVGCSSSNMGNGNGGGSAAMEPGQKQLQDYMQSLDADWANLPYVSRNEPPPPERGKTTEHKKPGYVCKTTPVNIQKDVQEFALFSGVPVNVFPGSMLSGRTLETARYGTISGPKAPLKVTAIVPWGPDGPAKGPTEEMKTISHSSYIDAFRKILHSDVSHIKVDYSFEIVNIYSQEQLKFVMNANVSGSNFNVAAHLDVKSEQSRQYALLSITQKYFSMVVDRPDYASQFFKDVDNVTIEQIKKEVTATNPPLYVSAMDYGRKIYILFETSEEALDIKASLEAGYDDVVNANGDVSTELKKKLESVSARGFVLGGGREAGTNVISNFVGGGNSLKALEKVKDWIHDGYIPSPDSPPAELGFTVSLLLDGSQVAVRSTTDYEERDCDVGVCPSGPIRGFANNIVWFALDVAPDPEIAPAGGKIGDTIKIQDGLFSHYNFPHCRSIGWKSVTLKCVPNQTKNRNEPWSPPGVWVEEDKNWAPEYPAWCHGFNYEQKNIDAFTIEEGQPPFKTDSNGYPLNPKDLWKW